jgi:hypothetical protein
LNLHTLRYRNLNPALLPFRHPREPRLDCFLILGADDPPAFSGCRRYADDISVKEGGVLRSACSSRTPLPGRRLLLGCLGLLPRLALEKCEGKIEPQGLGRPVQ